MQCREFLTLITSFGTDLFNKSKNNKMKALLFLSIACLSLSCGKTQCDAPTTKPSSFAVSTDCITVMTYNQAPKAYTSFLLPDSSYMTENAIPTTGAFYYLVLVSNEGGIVATQFPPSGAIVYPMPIYCTTYWFIAIDTQDNKTIHQQINNLLMMPYMNGTGTTHIMASCTGETPCSLR